MKMSSEHRRLAIAGGLLIAGTALVADGLRFSDYTPLPTSAGPVPVSGEATPIIFGNPDFRQRSLADRTTQLADGKPNSGNWDMITVNETGPHKGRYLFTVFETGQSGVQRTDLVTEETETIWQSPAPGGHVAFDASLLDTVWDVRSPPKKAGRPRPAGRSSPYGRLVRIEEPDDGGRHHAAAHPVEQRRCGFCPSQRWCLACRMKGSSSTRPATCISSTS